MTGPSRKMIWITLLALVSTASVYPSDVQGNTDSFPLYPAIQPNVAFWVKIFTEYSSTQGVIHDERDLNRIYGVIDLKDPHLRGSREINRQRIEKAKTVYRSILNHLMLGRKPEGKLELHVAHLFSPNADPEAFQSAQGRIRCQRGLKERFRAGLIRSGAYLEKIKGIFRQAGLPEDLAYLPHVESSFDFNAYSKRGAAGTWQFTRSTGRQFMQIGYAIDERLDPMISSRAAAKLLLQNYRKLETWPLAITAYNHGVNGMLRAKRSHGTYEAILRDYQSRLFGFASRNFYSEFLAARKVASNYRHYFGELELHLPQENREVVLSGYVPVQQLARHLKVDLEEIRKLNPALRSPIFDGQRYIPKGFHLRLPDQRNGETQVSYSSLPDSLYRSKQKRSLIHTVRRGESAGEIALRHGVKLHALIAANNLDSRATIYVNQKIKIPR